MTGQGSAPVPDPTILTSAAVAAASEQWRRDLTSLKETIGARLDAMDVATSLRLAAINDEPQRMALLVTNLERLQDVKFTSIDSKFADNERQTAREKAAADLALAAAFDAQKEAAAAQNNANAARTDKSEATVNETIKNNAETQRAGNVALSDKIDDLKDRVNRIEAVRVGGSDQQSNTFRLVGSIIAFFALLAAVVAIVIAMKP